MFMAGPTFLLQLHTPSRFARLHFIFSCNNTHKRFSRGHTIIAKCLLGLASQPRTLPYLPHHAQVRKLNSSSKKDGSPPTKMMMPRRPERPRHWLPSVSTSLKNCCNVSAPWHQCLEPETTTPRYLAYTRIVSNCSSTYVHIIHKYIYI